MKPESETRISIRRISIHNYKGIDQLKMEFPRPHLDGDPDIFVIGSPNGLGKTSILECCALLLLGPLFKEQQFRLRDRRSLIMPDLLIRANALFAEIRGDIDVGPETATVQIRIDRDGGLTTTAKSSFRRMLSNRWGKRERVFGELLKSICGFTPNPVIENTFLFFHSYRKVQEGNPEMAMMVKDEMARPILGARPRYEVPMSAFKLQILRSLMGRANLFELDKDQESTETINILNELVEIYAGGKISKLRPAADNTIDFRVNPVDGGESFTFDGLSSGQKEIISTLFLIWYHTRNCPSVVFIDEPELHLNAQWHRIFVQHLVKMSSHNQYIIATHSEDVMDSVSQDRRALLFSE